MNVYLAGYIDGENIKKCAEWRKLISQRYYGTSITILDPLNGKDFSTITKDGLTSNRSPSSILARDMMSVTEADVIVANMDRFGKSRISVGTISEIAWAIWDDKPIIMITDEDQFIKHPFYSRVIFYKTIKDMLDSGIIDYFEKGVIDAIY